MAKGIGYPPPAQFPGLTTPGIPVAKHGLEQSQGESSLATSGSRPSRATPDFFFLNYLSVKCRGPTADPTKDASPSLNDELRRTMRFAQMVCWSWPPSLSGPGPVVLQVRLSPLVAFSQMTKNNGATLSLILWNRSSSKACHIPWVTHAVLRNTWKKNWNFSNTAYVLGDFPWNWLKCRLPHPDLMYLRPIIFLAGKL